MCGMEPGRGFSELARAKKARLARKVVREISRVLPGQWRLKRPAQASAGQRRPVATDYGRHAESAESDVRRENVFPPPHMKNAGIIV